MNLHMSLWFPQQVYSGKRARGPFCILNSSISLLCICCRYSALLRLAAYAAFWLRSRNSKEMPRVRQYASRRVWTYSDSFPVMPSAKILFTYFINKRSSRMSVLFSRKVWKGTCRVVITFIGLHLRTLCWKVYQLLFGGLECVLLSLVFSDKSIIELGDRCPPLLSYIGKLLESGVSSLAAWSG